MHFFPSQKIAISQKGDLIWRKKQLMTRLCVTEIRHRKQGTIPNMSLPHKRKYVHRHYDFCSSSWCSVSDKVLFQFNQFPKVRRKDLSSYFAQSALCED